MILVIIVKLLTDIISPEGISIDWVSRNLYWTDSTKGTIEVASLETKLRKTLFSSNLTNPRGIAVHPMKGYSYYLTNKFSACSFLNYLQIFEYWNYLISKIY